MRMWMINPRLMCRKHLLGEHVECHMFAGVLSRKKGISGYIKNDLLEPKSLKKRHDKLVMEMTRRGYHHNSPLVEVDISYLPAHQQNSVVNVSKSIMSICNRCLECRKLHLASFMKYIRFLIKWG